MAGVSGPHTFVQNSYMVVFDFQGQLGVSWENLWKFLEWCLSGFFPVVVPWLFDVPDHCKLYVTKLINCKNRTRICKA